MAKIKNLLTETTEKLKEEELTWDDVRFVRTEHNQFTVDEAKKMMDFAYDAGYGGTEVDESLMVVGDDWWLERREYDGSEWWEFKTMPNRISFTTFKYKKPTFKK